jgi:hypothetical protein
VDYRRNLGRRQTLDQFMRMLFFRSGFHLHNA